MAHRPDYESADYKAGFEDGEYATTTAITLVKAKERKEWVSLTDGEMHECAGEYPWTPTGLKCCRDIEAKLKGKNCNDKTTST